MTHSDVLRYWIKQPVIKIVQTFCKVFDFATCWMTASDGLRSYFENLVKKITSKLFDLLD